MRNVIALEFVSLDGVIQSPGGPDETASLRSGCSNDRDNFHFRHQTTAFPNIQLKEMGSDAITRSARAR